MDPLWSLLLLLKPWMGHRYTVIQVVYWVEFLEQRRLCPIFVKMWIPINGHNSVTPQFPGVILFFIFLFFEQCP